MAVVKEKQGTKLVLAVEVGLTASGAAKYAQRSIAKMNPAVSDSDLLDIGEGFGALQVFPVGSIVRQDTAVLVRE